MSQQRAALPPPPPPDATLANASRRRKTRQRQKKQCAVMETRLLHQQNSTIPSTSSPLPPPRRHVRFEEPMDALLPLQSLEEVPLGGDIQFRRLVLGATGATEETQRGRVLDVHLSSARLTLRMHEQHDQRGQREQSRRAALLSMNLTDCAQKQEETLFWTDLMDPRLC